MFVTDGRENFCRRMCVCVCVVDVCNINHIKNLQHEVKSLTTLQFSGGASANLALRAVNSAAEDTRVANDRQPDKIESRLPSPSQEGIRNGICPVTSVMKLATSPPSSRAKSLGVSVCVYVCVCVCVCVCVYACGF